jgi:hypothetical protein
MIEELEPEQLGDEDLEDRAQQGDETPNEGPDVSELDEDPAYNAEGPAGDLKGG